MKDWNPINRAALDRVGDAIENNTIDGACWVLTDDLKQIMLMAEAQYKQDIQGMVAITPRPKQPMGGAIRTADSADERDAILLALAEAMKEDIPMTSSFVRDSYARALMFVVKRTPI